MTKEIWFDMDGTIVDFYGVTDWLNYLNSEDTYPYENAKAIGNLRLIAYYCNRLIKQGWKVNIVSWTSKKSTDDFNKRISEVKKEWLGKHLKSVHFNTIDIIPYGTPKQNGRTGILFDDEEKNRQCWSGEAYHPNDIISTLKDLLTAV